MSTETQNMPQPYGVPSTNEDASAPSGACSHSDIPSRSDGPAAGTAGVHPTAVGTGARPSTNTVGNNQQSKVNAGSAGDKTGTAENDRQNNTGPGAGTQGSGAQGEGEGGGDDGANSTAPEEGYPEQLHAGHVDGVGPEYASKRKTTLNDRITGVKEQIKGTIKRDPALKQKGHDRMTGALKKKELEDEENADPYKNAGEGGDKKDEEKKEDEDKKEDEGPQRPGSDKRDVSDSARVDAGTTGVPHAHPTDKGAREQAANVAPEGSQPSEREQQAKQTAEAGQPAGNAT